MSYWEDRMAHFILEYSSNLEGEIDIPLIFENLHMAAIASGVFPIGGLRSRAVRCDQYRIADGSPELGFVHLTLKMGAGRSLEIRRTVGEQLFEVLKVDLDPVFQRRHIGISFEITEIHPELNFKRNNIHERFKDRTTD